MESQIDIFRQLREKTSRNLEIFNRAGLFKAHVPYAQVWWYFKNEHTREQAPLLANVRIQACCCNEKWGTSVKPPKSEFSCRGQ